MIFQLVQIVGQCPEALVEVLRQELNQESLVQAVETPDLDEAAKTIPILLPDLVVIFVDPEKASDPDQVETIRAFCQNIRDQLAEHRSIIVVSAVAADKEARINYFLSGADDFLPADTEAEEFAVRLLVHLRRNVETLSNKQTRLPGLGLFSRIIQRLINLQGPWALLAINLNNLHHYSEVYGRIPFEQILRTLAALLKSAIIPPDVVGQSDIDQFWVISTPEKAEKLAALLCAKFDEVVPTFYSERDQKRGYIVSVVNEQISRRVPFVSLSVGVVSSSFQPHENYVTAFNTALELKQQAQNSYGSAWVSETHKLSGSSIAKEARQKNILIVESDAAMAYLLKTTLEMQSYQVEIAIDADEAQRVLTDGAFDMLIVDALLHGQEQGLALCQWVRQNPSYQETTIICTSTLHDREKALSAGADIYLPKPFDLTSLFNWVDYFLRS